MALTSLDSQPSSKAYEIRVLLLEDDPVLHDALLGASLQEDVHERPSNVVQFHDGLGLYHGAPQDVHELLREGLAYVDVPMDALDSHRSRDSMGDVHQYDREMDGNR